MNSNLPHSKLEERNFLEIVYKAGQLAKNFNRNRLQIFSKGSKGLYTNADLEVEEFLIKKLKRFFPQATFLAEENFEKERLKLTSFKNNKKYFWTIDPIDGTNNFISDLPLYCVTVTLIYMGDPIFGALYAPALNEFYYSHISKGSFKVKFSSNGENYSRKRIQVSDQFHLEKKYRIFSKPNLSQVEAKSAKAINRLNVKTKYSVCSRRFGSAALESTYVVLGKVDGFWSRKIKPWDIAFALLLKESYQNVQLLDIYGEEFSLFSDSIWIQKSDI